LTPCRIVTAPAADHDIEVAISWYEHERPGLDLEFVGELRSAYDRVVGSPFGYQVLGLGGRRSLVRRFPYIVYFIIEGNVIELIDISGLTREERSDLLERLWDSLTANQEDYPLWDWQREEPDRRLDAFERDGIYGVPVEEVLARLRGRDE
jgi:putative addiction module component (TIGR02574 family)